jgi:acyl dehydratase
MNLEEIRDKISLESEPMTCEVEKGMLRKFVQAIDDHNPLWQDDEYAGKTKFGGIMAPPTFLLAIGFEQFQQQTSELVPLFKNVLNGGTELECHQPVRPGDKLILTTRMIDISERETKMGKTTFITLETIYRKKREGLVAKCRQILIGY